MRGVIIGLSALALASLPTLALADGNGAVTGAAGGAIAGAVVGGPVGRGGRRRGRRRHRRGGVEPSARGRRPGPRRPVQHADDDGAK